MSTFETKEIYVKAHVRIIRQKSYRFVCKQCNQVSERICFPSQPLYCERCRPPKSTLKVERPSTVKPKRKRINPETEKVVMQATVEPSTDTVKAQTKKTRHKATAPRRRAKK